MGLFPNVINGKKVIDWDDQFAQTAVLTHGTNGNSVLDFRTKSGKQGYIVGYRQAWDSGLDPNATLHLLVNGHNQDKYESITVQLAPPEAEVFLPIPIPIEQNSRLQVTADIGGSNDGRVTARLLIAYTDLYTQ